MKRKIRRCNQSLRTSWRTLRIEPLEPRRLLATTQWIGPNNGSWSTPGNWSAGVPGADDTAFFNLTAPNASVIVKINAAVTITQLQTATGTVTLNLQQNTLTTAVLDATHTGAIAKGGNLTIENGTCTVTQEIDVSDSTFSLTNATISCPKTLVATPQTAFGTMNIQGSKGSLGGTQVCATPGGVATLNLSSGSSISASGLIVGNLGNGTVKIDGSTLSTGPVIIGTEGGTGSVNILDKGDMISSPFGDGVDPTPENVQLVGFGNGSTGTVNITGPSSGWSIKGFKNDKLHAINGLIVGVSGTGNVNVTNGGTLSVDGSMAIGSLDTRPLAVAPNPGTGNVNVVSASVDVSGNISVGEVATCIGTFSASGFSKLTASDVSVGEGGTGTMTLSNVIDTIKLPALTIGQLQTGNGTLNVAGSRLIVTSPDFMHVGVEGAATLNLTGQADVTVQPDVNTATWTDFGLGNGPTTVLVTGGSTLTVGNGLNFLANSTLTINDGSLVTSHPGSFMHGQSLVVQIGDPPSSGEWDAGGDIDLNTANLAVTVVPGTDPSQWSNGTLYVLMEAGTIDNWNSVNVNTDAVKAALKGIGNPKNLMPSVILRSVDNGANQQLVLVFTSPVVQPASPLNLHSIGPNPPPGGYQDYQIEADTYPFEYAGLGVAEFQSVTFYSAPSETQFDPNVLADGGYTEIGEAASYAPNGETEINVAVDAWTANIPLADLTGGTEQSVFAVATYTSSAGSEQVEIGTGTLVPYEVGTNGDTVTDYAVINPPGVNAAYFEAQTSDSTPGSQEYTLTSLTGAYNNDPGVNGAPVPNQAGSVSYYIDTGAGTDLLQDVSLGTGGSDLFNTLNFNTDQFPSYFNGISPVNIIAVTSDYYSEQSYISLLALNPGGLPVGQSTVPMPYSSPAYGWLSYIYDGWVDISTQATSGSTQRTTTLSFDWSWPGAGQVDFFANAGSTDPATAQLVGVATASGGDGLLSVNIDTTNYSGNYTFWAVPSEDLGDTRPAIPVTTTFDTPTFGSISTSTSPQPYVDPGLNFSANVTPGTNPSDTDYISSVEFYQDIGGGFATAVPVAAGEYESDNSDGSEMWSANLDTSQLSGPQTFYAVATNYVVTSDGFYEKNSVVSAPITVNLEQPVIQGLSASLDSSTGSTLLTLTPQGIEDVDNAVASVSYFLNQAGGQFDDAELIGTTTDADNGFAWNLDPASLPAPGAYTFYATATDAAGGVSAPVQVTVGPIEIGQISAGTNGYYATNSQLSVSVGNSLDWNSGESVTSVAFYPVSSSGGPDTNVAALGTATASSGWSASIPTTGWSGDVTFYAVAYNGATAEGTPIAITVSQDQDPTIDSLSVTGNTSTGTPQFTLTANGVSTSDGNDASVEFFEGNPNGTYQRLGSASGATGWTLNVNPAPLSSPLSGPEQFYAIATDDLGLPGDPTTTEITVGPMVIGQVAASNQADLYTTTAGSTINLTASGVVDWDGISGLSVNFYPDNGSGQPGSTALGGSLVHDTAKDTWTLSGVDTTGWSGPTTVWTVASDGANTTAVPITLYADQAPVIDSLMASTESWAGETALSLTPEGVSSSDGNILDIAYFWAAGANASFNSATPLGTITDGDNNWVLNVDPNTFNSSPGPVTIFAVASDDMGLSNSAAPASLTVEPLLIGQISASNGTDAYVAGQGVTIGGSSGLLDRNGSSETITVNVYSDAAGSNLLAYTTAHNDGGAWSVSIPSTATGGWTGPTTLYVRATDNSGGSYAMSDYVQITLFPDMLPTIDSLAASTDITQGSTPVLTLVANSSDDPGNTIQSVTFYQGTAAGGFNSASQLGTVLVGINGWNLDVASTAIFSNTDTFYAQAVDGAGLKQLPVELAYNPLAVGQLTASSQFYVNDVNYPLILTAQGLLDLTDGQSIDSVTFYQDLSGSGVYNADSVKTLQTVSVPSGGTTASCTVTPSGWSGPQTFFAITTDSAGGKSPPMALTVMPDEQPLITSLTAVPSTDGLSSPPSLNDLPAAGMPTFGLVSRDATTSSLLFSADVWDGAEYIVQTVKITVASDASVQVRINGTPHNYDSWWAFKASSDFDPMYWSNIEGSLSGSGAATVASFFYDLEENNGRGLASQSTLANVAVYDAAQTLTLQANLADTSQNQIVNVSFYKDVGGGGFATATWLGTVYDGSQGWALPVDPSGFSSSQIIYAVATDSMGQQSSPFSSTVQSVLIGQLATAADSDLYVTGSPVTLCASGMLDWNPGRSVSSVSFYQDLSGTGVYNSASVRYLNSVGTADVNGVWSLTGVDTTGWSGPQAIFAIATDGVSTSDPIALTIYPDQSPTIDSISASTDTSTGSPVLTLTANGVSGGNSAASLVTFYRNGVSLGTATAATGWTLTGIDYSNWTAPQTFSANVTDDLGQVGPSTSFAVQPVVAGPLTANQDSYTSGDTLTLSVAAEGILDLNAAPISGVTFYQDLSGTGVFNAASVRNLGPGTLADGVWSLDNLDSTGWSGPQTFFVRAADAAATSDPVALTIYPDQSQDGVTLPPSPIMFRGDDPESPVSIGYNFNTTVSGGVTTVQFTSADWNAQTSSYTNVQTLKLKIAADGSITVTKGFVVLDSYPSWWDFKASNDFNPYYWSNIEGSSRSDAAALAVFSSLERANGLGSIATPSFSLVATPIGAVVSGQTLPAELYVNGELVTLNVAGLLNADATGITNWWNTNDPTADIAGISFYLDTSGTGVLHSNAVALLGAATWNFMSSESWSLSGVDTTGWIGPVTIFAIATDATGSVSDPLVITIYPYYTANG